MYKFKMSLLATFLLIAFSAVAQHEGIDRDLKDRHSHARLEANGMQSQGVQYGDYVPFQNEPRQNAPAAIRSECEGRPCPMCGTPLPANCKCVNPTCDYDGSIGIGGETPIGDYLLVLLFLMMMYGVYHMFRKFTVEDKI